LVTVDGHRHVQQVPEPAGDGLGGAHVEAGEQDRELVPADADRGAAGQDGNGTAPSCRTSSTHHTTSEASRTANPSTTSRHGAATVPRSRHTRTSSGDARTIAVSNQIMWPSRPAVSDDPTIPAAPKASSTRFVVCTRASCR
jgi:hypothetical protein